MGVLLAGEHPPHSPKFTCQDPHTSICIHALLQSKRVGERGGKNNLDSVSSRRRLDESRDRCMYSLNRKRDGRPTERYGQPCQGTNPAMLRTFLETSRPVRLVTA